jgi:hypothetical protein
MLTTFFGAQEAAMALSAGMLAYNQQQYVLLTSNGSANTVDITMLLVGSELLWIVQESQSVSPVTQKRMQQAAAPPMPSVTPSPATDRRASISGSPLSTGVYLPSFSSFSGASSLVSLLRSSLFSSHFH